MNPAWIILAAAIATSILGQVLLKTGASGSVAASASFVEQLFRWHSIVGLGCYAAAALLYMIALRKIPMSVALPCTAASYVVIAVVGWAVFGETLDAMKLLAIGLICGGVVLLATTA
jgi:small multidrug resistance pump